MKPYMCQNCDYITFRKSDLNKHLKTKKHLKTLKENGGKNTKSLSAPQYHLNLTQKDTYSPQNHSNLQCTYCQRNYTRVDNLNRHIKTCKMKTKHNETQSNLIEQMKEREERLMKQIELLLTKVGNNYTTINNTNTNNNIQLNNYGSEDLSHITDALKTYLIKHPFGAIQQLIEKIHFNRDKPENINLMITNKRDNKISVYEDGKWVYRNKKKTIQRLIDNKYYILDDHYNDIDKKELSEFNHTNYKSFSGKMDENDKQLLEQLYEDAEIIILNKQEKSE